MQNGYYQVAGAFVTQFNILDTTTNNLANVNTSGFKRDGVVVGDFERVLQDKRDEMSLSNGSDRAAKFLNRAINKVPRVVKRYIDFTPSSRKFTGNKLDIALNDGNSFFAVKTPNGVKLTQQSGFSLNSSGELVTKEGYKVLPTDFINTQNENIVIPNNTTKLKIDDDGTIYANGINVGKIFVGKVKNLNEVTKLGDNLYDVKDMQNRLVPLQSGNLVAQGYKNLSNVNAVKEMVSLIESNRMVEIYQKVMVTQMDDLNRDAITKLASVKA